MKLEREKSGSSWEWRLDVTIARRRYRETFTSKQKAAEFVAELKVQARRSKHGLERDRARVTVAELVAAHGSEVDQARPRGRQMKKITV
jgi:hypothetical protein